MSAPAVSILLPVRDGIRFLDACLRSLARQTWKDYELVAVDDGSRDGSLERLCSRARRDARIRVLRSPSRGLVAALEHGLAHCRGEFVARMDADDVAHPRRLELQLRRLLEAPKLGVVSSLVRFFPRSQLGEGMRLYEAWLNRLRSREEILRDRFIESPLPHPSVTFRAAAVREAGGYRDRGWPEDYDLWLRLARRGVPMEKLPLLLMACRDHADRATRRDSRYAVESFLRCKAHHLARGPLADAAGVVVWGAGQMGRRLSKHLLREGVRLEAFLDIDPRKIGRRLRDAPIHPPPDLSRLLSGDRVLLVAVGSRGARARIRARLALAGLEETRDYWCVA